MSKRNVFRPFRNTNFAIGFSITLAIVVMALVSVVYTTYDPNRMNLSARYEAPNKMHWFGTDQYGRDIFSRVMKGSINSILVGLVTVSIGLILENLIIKSVRTFATSWNTIASQSLGWRVFSLAGSLSPEKKAILSGLLSFNFLKFC